MRYTTSAAFRQALEERLRQREQQTGEPLVRLRKRVVFERCMARLQKEKNSPWVLKGGFALELRLGERARVTKDLDLGVDLGYFNSTEVSSAGVARKLREDLSAAAMDHFAFVVPESGEEELGIPGLKSYRYAVEARLDGRRFEAIRVDVGLGDPLISPFDELTGSDLLSYAGISPATIRTTSRAQHFSEKVHALTRPFEDRINTRVKDLADIMLLMKLGLPDESTVTSAVREIFKSRGTHGIPNRIEIPPVAWVATYSAVATNLNLQEATIESAIERLNNYWTKLFS